MFVEISRSAFEKLKARLNSRNISYEVSDCTLPGEEKVMVHVEFPGFLSKDDVEVVNNWIDVIYGEDATEVRDKDFDGIPDKLEKETGEVVEVRRRTWDDKMRTPVGEAARYITGKNTEEEVTYETR